MPAPVVTVRELKNTDSGVDISVPYYKETTGLFSNVVDFNVVVVSKLRCFKLPSHRDSDTVQFLVTKKYEDFETLLKTFQLLSPTTALPKLPRLYFGLNEISGREMQVAVDALMKAIAMDTTLVTSELLLRFLGIDPVKVANSQVHSSSTTESTDLAENESNGDDERTLFADQDEDADEDVGWLTSGHKPQQQNVRGDNLFSGEETGVETRAGVHNAVHLAPGWMARADGLRDDDDDLDTILQSNSGSVRGQPIPAHSTTLATSVKPAIKPKTSARVTSEPAVTHVDKLAVGDIFNYIATNQTTDDVDLFS